MVTTQEHNKILVLAVQEDGEVASVTLELLRAGRELVDKVGGELCAAIIGHEVGDAAGDIALYADKVYSIDHALLGIFQVDFYVDALQQFFRIINPDIIVMGHTLDNQDVAPRLAFKLQTQVITDCIGIDIDAETGSLLCTKPVYGENAIATFIVEKKPQMATLRPKVVEAMDQSKNEGEVVRFDPVINESLTTTELIETVLEETVSLDKADAIVAGGRGITKIEGLKQLEGLAKTLKRYFDKVEVGASRPLVDAGWLFHSRQIGLTGQKANPELYIAIGISGALQHMTGIFNSKKIVAINKDEQAPIFNYADYGIVGEYEDVVPGIIKKLEGLP